MNLSQQHRAELRCTLQRSLAEVERSYYNGYVSEEVWRRFLFLWTWGTARFGGIYGARHDRAYAKLGRSAYERRIARVAAMIARVRGWSI